jgi:hypothetical protein
MSGVPPAYRKVSGRGLTLTGRGRIWLADDHLIEVISSMVVESYRRYFFQDTMAFVVQRTKTRLAWAWVQGGIGFVALLLGVGAAFIGASNSSEEWHVVMYILGGIAGALALICLTLLMINLLLGPSCRCHILTSTGWHALAAPTRLGPALRLQARVVPAIEAAQSATPAPGYETS